MKPSAVYVENEIELSWPIRYGTDCDENWIEQLCDWSYRYGLHKKWIWVVLIDKIR